MKKKISIIIPNYNNKEYLKNCLDSIFSQTYKNIEVIFIDDQSTDQSVEFVENYMNNCNVDIKIIKQFNQNASIARNRGIEISTGDYLYFLDSDDEIHDECVLEKLVNKINDFDLVIGNYEIIDKNGNKIEDYIVKDNISNIDNDIYKFAIVSPVPSNKLYKKDIVDKNNLYFDNTKIGQDLNFYLKYLSCCQKISVCDELIYKYRILSTGMSKSKNTNLFDIVPNFEKIKKFYINNNKLTDYQKYITLVEFINYNIQMEKQVNYRNYKYKKLIYDYFNLFIKQIDLSLIEDKKTLKNKLKKYKIKRFLKYIYLSKIYINIKEIRK